MLRASFLRRSGRALSAAAALVGVLAIASGARADDEPLPELPEPAPTAPAPTEPLPVATEPAPPPLPVASEPVAAPPPPKCTKRDRRQRRCTCGPGDRVKGGKCEDDAGLGFSLLGIRPSLTHLSMPGRTTDDIGVAFAGAFSYHDPDGVIATSMGFHLGGGQAGFDGQIGGSLDLGFRVPHTPEHGPFLRAGLDGRLQGNDAFYYSALELPRMQFGWQYASEPNSTLLEVGVRTGPILTGRFNPGGAVRSTAGAWEVGGGAVMHFDFLHVEGAVMRYFAGDTGDGSAVDLGRASLCAGPQRLALCADVLFLQGTARTGPPDRPTGMPEGLVTYAGFTVGASRW